jgi:nitrite reductase (NADH) small subunit
MNARTDNWIAVGLEVDIPLRGARVVRTSVGDIAVFRTASGNLYATEDRCPHRGGPLSQGIVHGESVTCPLHNWVIDLASGQAAQGVDTGCVRTIPVRTEGGRILLDLTAFLQKAVA